MSSQHRHGLKGQSLKEGKHMMSCSRACPWGTHSVLQHFINRLDFRWKKQLRWTKETLISVWLLKSVGPAGQNSDDEGTTEKELKLLCINSPYNVG